MSKYISENPEDQPLHDMMDEIEKIYVKLEDMGIHPTKIKAMLLQIVTIFSERHPEYFLMDYLK